MFTNHPIHNGNSPPPSSITAARRTAKQHSTPLPVFPTIIPSHPQSPETWWSTFIRHSHIPPTPKILDELSKGIEGFHVDHHKGDPFLLRIWLAYIETHWKLNNDIDESRRMFKYLKSMHLGVSHPELFLYWSQFEYALNNHEKAVSVLKNGLEYIRRDVRLEEALKGLSTDSSSTCHH